MRNGSASAHRRQALPTAGGASSSPPGLPTPVVTDAKGARPPGSVESRGADGGLPRKLNEIVSLLPTTNATDWKGPSKSVGRERNNRGKMIPRREGDSDLSEAVTTLLKTPTRQLGINGGSQDPAKRKAGGHGPTLDDEVSHLLPTVMSHDSGSSPESFLERKDRPTVTSLTVMAENGLFRTGGRLSGPSADGSPSSGVTLPLQLSLDDTESPG
jgi:hypothetical protein